MAAEDYLTDEEQAEALRKWFSDNWMWMAAGVVIALVVLVGYQRYQRFRIDRAAAAVGLLDQLATAQTTDEARANALLKQLNDDYSATPYADQAHLLVAQHAVQAGKYDQAGSELRIVMNSGHDEQLRSVARLRLARILIQQQKADDALQLLNADKAGAFAAPMHEVRGDALSSRNDRNGARAEYQAALDDYKNVPGADTSMLQLKADELNSDTVAVAVAPK
ncbi:MAG: tetratricopeptide repeat protein [Steroidobacter sp.]